MCNKPIIISLYFIIFLKFYIYGLNSDNLVIENLISNSIQQFINEAVGLTEDYNEYINAKYHKNVLLSNDLTSYFYFEYNNGINCDGNTTLSIGYATDTCLQLYSLNNIAVGSMKGICTDESFDFLIYSDPLCNDFHKSVNYGALNSCQTSTIYGPSQFLKCSSASLYPPVTLNSIVMLGYERGASSCNSNSPSVFVSFNNNNCYNSTDNNIPFSLNCKVNNNQAFDFSNENITISTFTGSNTCSTSTTATTLPSGCLLTGSSGYNKWNDLLSVTTRVISTTVSSKRKLLDSINSFETLTYYYSSSYAIDYFQLGCYNIPPVPTYNPTASPTRNTTYNPTISPSISTSSLPTTNPTINPTIIPTLIPTNEPTYLPSVFPTAAPSSESPTVEPSSYSPTVSPTLQPTPITNYPTISPTNNPTTSPTLSPTVAYIAQLDIKQVFINCNYTDYLLHSNDYDDIFINAIAFSIPIVNSNNIYNFTISPVISNTTNNRRLFTKILNNHIQLHYTLRLLNIHISSVVLYNQVKEILTNGSFSLIVKEISNSYNITSLSNITSEYINIINNSNDFSPSDSLSKKSNGLLLSPGAIGGISAGGLVFVIIVSGMIYMIYQRKSSNQIVDTSIVPNPPAPNISNKRSFNIFSSPQKSATIVPQSVVDNRDPEIANTNTGTTVKETPVKESKKGKHFFSTPNGASTVVPFDENAHTVNTNSNSKPKNVGFVSRLLFSPKKGSIVPEPVTIEPKSDPEKIVEQQPDGIIDDTKNSVDANEQAVDNSNQNQLGISVTNSQILEPIVEEPVVNENISNVPETTTIEEPTISNETITNRNNDNNVQTYSSSDNINYTRTTI